MRILKSIVIAFSIYSKIPVPQFEWKEEDMEYMMCFFPWIGIVIGLCIYFWRVFSQSLGIGEICYTLIGGAIPLMITGGFHVDGYMDTMDAFHSYQSREKKLEILKDSHIGAFAAIMLGAYGLIYLGAFSEIQEENLLKIVCAGFVLARCLSGLSVVSFPPAKKSGLFHIFSSSAQKTKVKISLYVQGAACMVYMVGQSLYAGIIVPGAAFCAFIYYYYRCKKEFGGFTGDTAGYCVLLCEGSMIVAAALLNILA